MNRSAVAWSLVLLTIFQMMVVPVASAVIAADAGCEHVTAVHEWHADPDCASHSHRHPGNGVHRHSAGASGNCHCIHIGAHAQAVTGIVVVARIAAQPEALAAEPKGPAYSAPLYEFLRPPN